MLFSLVACICMCRSSPLRATQFPVGAGITSRYVSFTTWLSAWYVVYASLPILCLPCVWVSSTVSCIVV